MSDRGKLTAEDKLVTLYLAAASDIDSLLTKVRSLNENLYVYSSLSRMPTPLECWIPHLNAPAPTVLELIEDTSPKRTVWYTSENSEGEDNLDPTAQLRELVASREYFLKVKPQLSIVLFGFPSKRRMPVVAGVTSPEVKLSIVLSLMDTVMQALHPLWAAEAPRGCPSEGCGRAGNCGVPTVACTNDTTPKVLAEREIIQNYITDYLIDAYYEPEAAEKMRMYISGVSYPDRHLLEGQSSKHLLQALLAKSAIVKRKLDERLTELSTKVELVRITEEMMSQCRSY